MVGFGAGRDLGRRLRSVRVGWVARVRHTKRQAHAVAKEARHLRAMPPRVAAFYLRAWVTLMRTRDGWSSIAVTRPSDVVRLLALARGRPRRSSWGPARRGRRPRSRWPTIS